MMLPKALLAALCLFSSVNALPATTESKVLEAGQAIHLKADGSIKVLSEADKKSAIGENKIINVADSVVTTTEYQNVTTRSLDDLEKRCTSSYQYGYYCGDNGNKWCPETKKTLNQKITYFNDWDIQMSSVVRGPATVTVSSGYYVSDAIGVSVSSELSIVKDVLSVTEGVTYTKTWTTTYNAAYSFSVPAGKYGVIVSNPYTQRRTGQTYEGPGTDCCYYSTCTKVSSVGFQADKRFDASYNGMSWVEGIISLCTSSSYPVRKCTGSGTIH